MAYVLPNRKAFADAIARTFLKYRKLDPSTEDGEPGKLFYYQALVRDYLAIETPYRGLLLYHGLGSGKTCSSIAVAESLMSQKRIYVMLPASLQDNYRGEIRKCGDPIYRRENYWQVRPIRSDADREAAKALGISDTYLDTHGSFYTTVAGRPSNFDGLPADAKQNIQAQIEDILNQRFTFLNYNGLSQERVKELLTKETFEDTVVIIDEAHNLISRVSNESAIATPLYQAILKAKSCKVVALSGTPMINRPVEIALLMNLLRGAMERITIPLKVAGSWDENAMTQAFRNIPDVDTIEFNGVKKAVLLTRNPPHFRSVYNEKGDRTAVQYMKDMEYIPDPLEWVKKLQLRLETDLPGTEILLDRVNVEDYECLPSNPSEFAETFLDGLSIKNPLLFQRRIQGLVSYYKGADEKVLPRRVDDEHLLEKIPMSEEQLGRYLEVRFGEIQRAAKKRMGDDEEGNFLVLSRLACEIALPAEVRDSSEPAPTSNDAVPDKKEVVAKMIAQAGKFLTEEALARYSPKMLKMLRNLKDSIQGDARRNQFVYSQYRSAEGLGVFSAILEAHGFQRYRLLNQGGNWTEDPSMDDRPAYAFYTGEEDRAERELVRQVFNGIYSDTFPPALKEQISARPKRLCVLMASSSGAEGITLNNVRHVHIMEPHWNPARHEQVIGRAIRINSHATLPEAERTVRISFYLSTIPESAKTGTDNNLVLIRRNDIQLKRYEGDPPSEVFMSTDEYLYEKAYEKSEISRKVAILLKQAAVDCEIHRKLHLKNEPQLMCVRFDTTAKSEDLAFKPSLEGDERDAAYLRNRTRRARQLQRVQIKDIVLLLDPDSKEVFDAPAFEDHQRLLRLGVMGDRQIQFFA